MKLLSKDRPFSTVALLQSAGGCVIMTKNEVRLVPDRRFL